MIASILLVTNSPNILRHCKEDGGVIVTKGLALGCEGPGFGGAQGFWAYGFGTFGFVSSWFFDDVQCL